MKKLRPVAAALLLGASTLASAAAPIGLPPGTSAALAGLLGARAALDPLVLPLLAPVNAGAGALVPQAGPLFTLLGTYAPLLPIVGNPGAIPGVPALPPLPGL